MISPTGHPATSLTSQPRSSAGSEVEAFATIEAKVSVAEQVLHCRLTLHTSLPYRPGQYCMVAIGDTARAYSFATPSGSTTIEFLISVAPGGLASRFWQNAQVGQSISLTGPYGDFLVREDDGRPLLYIAGGVGFAPIRSHLLWLINQKNPRPLTLVVGHASRQRMFWDTDLKNLAAQHSFTYHGLVGRPLDTLDTIQNLPEQTVYICGSAAMCTITAEALYKKDVPPSQVHYELFT